MELSIYIKTHDIASLKKRDVPIVMLHFQTPAKGIEGVDNISKALSEAKIKLGVALGKIATDEVIYGEWI